jgi:hypothetical protein
MMPALLHNGEIHRIHTIYDTLKTMMDIASQHKRADKSALFKNFNFTKIKVDLALAAA